MHDFANQVDLCMKLILYCIINCSLFDDFMISSAFLFGDIFVKILIVTFKGNIEEMSKGKYLKGEFYRRLHSHNYLL